MSVVIFITLLCGIGAGTLLGNGADAAVMEKMSSLLLLLLLFSVGIDMGLNKQVFDQIKKQGFKILLIPVGVAIGSLLGGSVVSLFFPQSLKECLAISSGMGWYSLSGILLTKAGNATGGTISFLANVMRELLTFVSVPFIAKHINYYCAIAPGGATAMDTTLAIISRNTNATVAVMAFVSGVCLTMIVPILVPIFL